MFRSLSRISIKNNIYSLCYMQRQTFLTNEYKCGDAWSSQTASPILTKINLNDFYSILDQNYTSKGVISAIDVDIFANAIKDTAYLEELKDLLHKLRLSAETGNTLESTHHATVRNFIDFGHIQELIDILKDPLNFGVFLDSYTANILLDNLITSEDYEKAATVASLVMLQEDFTHDITCALSQYAAYKHITTYTPPTPEPPPPEQKNKKVEEIKIRVKYLRNPYFDDHFDLKDSLLLAGKTLAWISERNTDVLHKNLEVLGWLFYKKYDKLLTACEGIKTSNVKVFGETIDLLNKEVESAEEQSKEKLKKCIELISKSDKMDKPLEEAIKIAVENSINKLQKDDIAQQRKLFDSWIRIREEKLEEQTKRLDRAKRIELLEQKQKELQEEEQKLWFFENEEAIDLQIEEKEKLKDTTVHTKSLKETDENYIPPEILPKRR